MSKSACVNFRQSPAVTRRQMERLLDFLSFISRYIQRGRLYLLPLIAHMLRISCRDFRDLPLPHDSKFLHLLSIWEDDFFLRTKGGGRARALWQSTMLSSWKELTAIHLSLLHFFPSLINKVVLPLSNNTTALGYLRNKVPCAMTPFTDLLLRSSNFVLNFRLLSFHTSYRGP